MGVGGKVTFNKVLNRLRELLREKVKNGQLTERGMARSTGVSQPHLHNILKGIRALPPDLADQLMTLAQVNLLDLIAAARPIAGGVPAPERPRTGNEETRTEDTPAVFQLNAGSNEEVDDTFAKYRLPADAAMEPTFQEGDVVYYQRSARQRISPEPDAAYLVNHNERVVARYLRMGDRHLYLVSESTLDEPVRWDYVSLADRHILDIVRGRIVWICRKLETIKTGQIEEARRQYRRVG